jgi:hypothetical protein
MEYAICINNQDYPASLEPKKIYQILPDPQAQKHQLIRVIDESGEDYLYPANYFISLELPEEVKKVVASVY